MWVVLAFISALCLGFYDISKKIALRDNAVVDVLTLSVIISSLLLSVPLLLSYACPSMMQQTLFYVPTMSLKGHLLTVLKYYSAHFGGYYFSCRVLVRSAVFLPEQIRFQP